MEYDMPRLIIKMKFNIPNGTDELFIVESSFGKKVWFTTVNFIEIITASCTSYSTNYRGVTKKFIWIKTSR
jgi:hypothetical protein